MFLLGGWNHERKHSSGSSSRMNGAALGSISKIIVLHQLHDVYSGIIRKSHGPSSPILVYSVLITREYYSIIVPEARCLCVTDNKFYKTLPRYFTTFVTCHTT